MALGFAAGFTGEEIIQHLDDIGIQNEFIWIENELSRINVKLLPNEGTEINARGPKISSEKAEVLLNQLSSLKLGDVLFLNGSIPSSMGADYYQRIMKNLEGKGVKIIVDTTGDGLRNVLGYHPFLIKPNQKELEEIFDCEIRDWKDVVYYAKELQKAGGQNVLVSMAGEGAVLVAKDGTIWRADVPDGIFVNGVGAGDSMLAGYVYSWLRNQNVKDAFVASVAAGSASAYKEGFVTKEEMEQLMKQVHPIAVSENMNV